MKEKNNNLDKETKRRIKILILAILGIIVLVSGMSYAFVKLSYTSDKVENINSCFDITMKDNGAINLNNAIPTQDTIGVNTSPYTYTITNTCDLDAYYETTINVLSPSKKDDASKVRVALYQDGYLTPSTLSTLKNGEITANFTNPLTNSIANYVVDEGYLPAKTTKTFKLAMWIGYDVTEFNDDFKTQILVTGIAKEAETLTNLSGGVNVLKNNTVINDTDYTKTTQDGLYYLKRNNEENTFYFRGTNVNNNITFANKEWKIVRINKDGSIKLVLNDSIGTSTYNNIDTTLNTWYNSNIKGTDYEKYVVQDNYCNDTTLSYKRVTSNKPKLKCNNTTKKSIGILSVDEVMLSNAIYNSTTKTSYLDSSTNTYTLTPAQTNNDVFSFGGTKQISIVNKTNTLGIRPTITITKDANLSGEGSTSNKYTITGLFSNIPEAYNDTTAPSIQTASVTQNWTNTGKQITISAFDESKGSGVSAYNITTSNTKPASNASTWVSMSNAKVTTTTKYNAGTYYVWVKDGSNNISASKTVTVNKIDTTKPTCTLTYAKTGKGYRLQITGQDSNQLAGKPYSFDGTNYQELSTKEITSGGTKTAYIKDIAGNTNTCTTEIQIEPNKPALLSNMIPVYYDSTSNVWKKANKNNNGGSWYNYDNKMWANAVTVTSTNRDTYLNASAGTTIPMSDINTMWVWVPRYTYTYLNTNTPQSINIKFEKGTASTGTIKCTDNVTGTSSTSETCTDTTNGSLKAETSTYTHPAFWWDKNDNNVREENEELTGIWVGKFEVSSDTSCTPSDKAAVGSGCNLQTIRPRVLPNVTSWRGAQVGTFFNGIQKMRESGNKYGFNTTDETHMMKNMEWGAVTYLSHSKYGINKEIAINSANTYTTGCGPQSEGSTSSGATCNGYTTALGQSASTTGNVTGVYDMSGGAYEYMMSNMVYSNGQQMSGNRTTNNVNSAFTGILYDSGNGTSFTGTYSFPSKRYYDKYSYGTSNKEYTRGKLGDATKEMAPIGSSGNWYSDYALFPASSGPWFYRGGLYSSGASAGAFGFDYNNGSADTYYSARAVLPGALD